MNGVLLDTPDKATIPGTKPPTATSNVPAVKQQLETADAAIRGKGFAGGRDDAGESARSPAVDFAAHAVGLPIADNVDGPDSTSHDGGHDQSEEGRVPDPPEPSVETPNSNHGLAVAAPVTDDHRDLENARPYLPEDQAARMAKRKETNFMVVIGSLCAIALMVFLIIYFVVESEKDSSSPAASQSGTINTTAAPRTPSEILMDLLPDYTVPKLQSTTSPQAKAFQWLTQDPNFSTYSSKRLQQRFALAAFFYSTNGERWGPSWLNQSQHECHWDFFMPTSREYVAPPSHRHNEYKYIDGPCVPSNESMVANYSTAMDAEHYDDYLYLAMYEQELGGDLPPEIVMLSSLKMIQLEYTTMEGTIPTILANLTSLRELHLFDSSFTGTIPSELGLLTELVTLEMGGTDVIYGTLPTELGLLSNLETLKIIESSVTGTIPLEYTGLRPLNIQLYRNQLTGTIHSEFGLMSTVEWLMLERNALTGTIPTELGAMGETLIYYLHENHLSGTIPTELGLPTSIRQIYLHTNSLTGMLPSELGHHSEGFWRLRLDSNHLTGTIPSEFGNLTMCHSFGIHSNLLTGTIPLELSGMTAMEYFRVKGNLLSGPFPSMADTSVQIIQFWLENNHLTGTIPSEIGNWTKLVQFKVDGNELTGQLPSELGLLTQIRMFHAMSNLLTGQIPSEIGNITTLKQLSIGDNDLTGAVPTELGLLVMGGALKLLNLTNNHGLTGELPAEVCAMTADPSLENVLEFDCGGLLCGCDCGCENVSAGVVLHGENGTALAKSKSGSA